MSEVDTDSLQTAYKDIMNLIGLNDMLELFNRYKGTQLNCPVHLYSRDEVVKRIRENIDHLDTAKFALKYQYTERWIRKMAKQIKEDDLK